jgi:Na+-driven multidrug efflux pump
MFIPHALLWIFCLKPTLRWFAPDLGDEIIEEGYNYFLVGLIGTYLGAFSDVLHSLLEVTDHYNYSMYSDVVGNIVGVLAFFAYVNINPGNEKSIVWVEVIDTVIILVFLFVDLYVTKRMKWFDDFWKGTLWNGTKRNKTKHYS